MQSAFYITRIFFSRFTLPDQAVFAVICKFKTNDSSYVIFYINQRLTGTNRMKSFIDFPNRIHFLSFE